MRIKLCTVCKELKVINCTEEEYARWRAGELIQKAMPNTPVDERELLVSGICGVCFDRMFKEK